MKDSDFYKLLRIMRNHPYLIKFQAENAYAETLLNERANPPAMLGRIV